MLSLRTVLFATDDSALAEGARPHAEALATRHGATLHVLRVERVAPADDLTPAAPSDTVGLGVVEAVRTGPTAEGGILAYADEISADVIVLGTHGRSGWQRWSLGSTAEAVLRRAPCPVLTVGADAAGGPGPVLAPLEFASSSDAALAVALAVAEDRGVGVVALHVVEPVVVPAPYAVAFDPLTQPEVRERAERTLDLWAKSAAGVVPVDTEIRGGRAAAVIVETAAETGAGLIVQASHGRRGLSRWLLGSVAELVVRTAPCPVLTIRGDSAPPWAAGETLAAVPAREWPALFDALAARTQAAPHAVTVEVVSPSAEGVVFRDAPLVGVAYDPHDDAVEVMTEGGGHHVVRPFAVRADAGAWEVEALALGGPGPHVLEVVRTDGARERITVRAAVPA